MRKNPRSAAVSPLAASAWAVAVLLVVSIASAAPSPKALELRDEGFAELENENPDRAEAAYRQLVEMLPKDPLGHANLAIALLRQQKHEEALVAIDRALAIEPGRGDLLAIRAEVLQWKGDLEGALGVLKSAADAAPQDLEILYAAYQLATTLRTEAAGAVAYDVLGKLAQLRPENLVVLLQLGQQAIAEGDRATASGTFLRVQELLWQAPPIAERALGMVTDALKGDDLSAARVPAVRLENVLKVSPMFRESLRELKTGIQGIPLRDLVGEPEPTSFGEPLDLRFAATVLDTRATAGRALATGDFDDDGRADLARIRADGKLEIRLAKGGWKAASEHAAAEVDELLALDVDNDGFLDLVAAGPKRGDAWRGAGDGTFTSATEDWGLAGAAGRGITTLDFDIEGDLDLVTVGAPGRAADLWRNNLAGPLDAVGSKAFPEVADRDARGVFPSDLDQDGDLDLVVAHGGGLTWLDNLRQGRFDDRTAKARLRPTRAVVDVVAADLGTDGLPELIGAGPGGLRVWRNLDGRFATVAPVGLPSGVDLTSVTAFDADNDGRLDLASAGPGGLFVHGQQADGSFARWPAALEIEAAAVVAADLDGDGDLDLAAAGPGGLAWLENQGGHRNGWLVLRLRGLDKGSSKNNIFGVGSAVEVRAGRAVQFREAVGDRVHLGLGGLDAAEVVRVVWTNGVPQNRLDVAGEQRLVEEQLLKGSCPFVYAWDGEGFRFVTDLLWGAPLGLPAAPGVWVDSDPSEIVRLDGLVDDGGIYRLRITEELWEAAFFDKLRLWVVDHPEDVEVASNLRIVPGAGPQPEVVLGSRDLRPMAAAWDGQGRDVTAEVARRDEVYADGYSPGPYQGVAEPWAFTFDLGEAPARSVRLHLEGWIFPADASLNLAVAQRDDYPYLPPRLEVETKEGWRTLMDDFGFPAGKTKTTVVDTPPLPPGATKLRIVSSLWLHWDRLRWTTSVADDAPVVLARLEASRADLRQRGFSALVRTAPNAPHTFDYARVRAESPWTIFPGSYTRFGDVRPLLAEAEDFSVVLAPGDELAVEVDARHLPPPAPGTRRTLFLESHGWDKDADRNTGEGLRLEPLPFHAMGSYPYPEGVTYPDTEGHRRYRSEWLTREIQ